MASDGEPQPPSDPHAFQNLQNLLGWLQHDPTFEDSVRQSYGNHPKFSFLFGGEGSEYYEAEKQRRGLVSHSPAAASASQVPLGTPYATAAAPTNGGAATAPAAATATPSQPPATHAPTPAASSASAAAPTAASQEQYTNGRGHPCRDFLRGKCTRGNACKFVHDANSADRAGEAKPGAVVCYDFLKGRCNRTQCKFSHQSNGRDDGHGTNVNAHGGAGPTNPNAPICNDYQKGKCFREKCRYRHVEPDGSPAGVPPGFGGSRAAGGHGSDADARSHHKRDRRRSREKRQSNRDRSRDRERSRDRSRGRSKSKSSTSRSRSRTPSYA